MSILDLAVDVAEPWYVRWPLKALGGVKAALGWALGHPVPAALILSLLGNAWLWHSRSAHDAQATRKLSMWQSAFAQEQHAYGVLAGALNTQNSAIRQWQLAGEIRHQIATRELRAAEQAGRPLIAAADALDRAAQSPVAPVTDCKTPADVLAQEGEL